MRCYLTAVDVKSSPIDSQRHVGRKGKCATRHSGGEREAYSTRTSLSQEDLGAASELHRTYVGSVERSERNLSIDSIASLAAGLGVEAWLLLRPVADSDTERS